MGIGGHSRQQSREIDSHSPNCGNHLVQSLRVSRNLLSEDVWERGEASDKLGRLAAESSVALDYLLELTGSPEVSVRAGAARALRIAAVSHPIAEQQLIFLLNDPEAWVSHSAGWSIIALISHRSNRPVPCDDESFLAEAVQLSWTPCVVNREICMEALVQVRAHSDEIIKAIAAMGLCDLKTSGAE